ncbi:MAG TPA: methyltransferase domain-containing protein [Ktedonobacterales bacterium]
MGILSVPSMCQRDAQLRELLDAETLDDAALRRNLADIRRINFLLGWTAFTVREVERCAREVSHWNAAGCPAFSLLDVASGSADIPLAIARWAARAGVDATIVATDISQQIVDIATEQATGAPNVMVARQDALALDYPAASFDIALCTLALHHFDPDAAVELLQSLARVGRRVLVFDVERSPLAYLGALALTRILRMNYMTCHDAPASVRRAYSASEVRTLAQRAGLCDMRVRIDVPFRLVLTARGGA